MRFLLCGLLVVACGRPPPPLPGVGALRLQLRDDECGEPVAHSVQLWRLGLVEDAEWYAGDHLQGSFEIPVEGLRIERLPHGRYRVYSDAFRTRSDDPPEFSVVGAETKIELSIPTRRSRRVFLRLYDEAGRLIQAGRYRRGGGHVWTRSEVRYPAWRVKRARKEGAVAEPLGGVPGSGPGERDSHAVTAGPSGFDLGLHTDAARHTGRFFWHHLQVEGRNEVQLPLRGEETRDRTYVGVAYSRSAIERSVFLPDGALAAAHHEVSAVCDAVLEDRQPAVVRIRVEGFKDVLVPLWGGEPFPICRLELAE